MEFFTTTAKPSRRAVDCVIVGVYSKTRLSLGAQDIDSASRGQISRLLKSGDIAVETGKVTMLMNLSGVAARRVAVVGLGTARRLDVRRFRQALASVMNELKHTRTRQLLSTLGLEEVSGTNPYYRARYTARFSGN